MDMYLIWFALTPQAWAGLLDNPEDRRQVLEPVFAAADGTLHGYGYAFGYVLGELPDDVVTAGIAVRSAASGAFGPASTTKLLTVEEMLTALRGAGGMRYRAPGAAG